MMIKSLTGFFVVKPVGGRKNKAPYETTHVRVPIPIKASVEALIHEFRESLPQPSIKPLTGLDETEDEQDEPDEQSELSDLETIKSQAEMIQSYASEIHYLKHKLDELNSLTSLDEAKELARKILVSKKSASKSVSSLLSAIYKTEVAIDELR
jgi:predicted RNase H-like nuclease (RuvC/YqgF family)